MAWRHVAATTAAGYKAFWSDKEIVLAAVAQYCRAQGAVGQDGRPLKHADEALREDQEFMLRAVRRHGSAFQ